MEQNTIFPIALTLQSKKRISNLLNFNLSQKLFDYNAIDITKDYNSKNSRSRSGFLRLISEDDDFISRQIIWLANKLQENVGKTCRFLLTLPNDVDDVNAIRNAFLNIQIQAGMTKIYIFCSPSENAESIQAYMSQLDDTLEYVLTLPISMKLRTLQSLLTNSLENNQEVVLIYEDSRDSKELFENLGYVLNVAGNNPEKLHMAFVPLDVNKYGDKDVLSSILISKGFKSVSLVDTKFKNFFSRWVNRRIKSTVEKIRESLWVNPIGVGYDEQHRDSCLCGIENNRIENIASIIGVKSLVTFHDLESLFRKYSSLKSNPAEREELLRTQEARVILTKLNFI